MKRQIMQKSIMALSIIVIVFLFIPMSVLAFQISDSFFMKDISGHWAEEDIKNLSYMGIIKGNSGQANPDSLISRAEFIALLVRALGYDSQVSEGLSPFKDVKTDDWYYNVLIVAKETGITKGNPDGTFSPNRFISREEIVLLLVRAMDLEKEAVSTTRSFKDIKSGYKYKSELNAAINTGIINGYADNTFRPGSNALRAEAAVMIKRMLSAKEGIGEEVKAKNAVQNLLREYMDKYIEKKNNKDSNIEFNLSHSMGKENDSNKTKAEIIKLYKQKKINVKEYLNNINIKVIEIRKNTATAVITYDVRYSRSYQDGSNRTKTYKAEKKFSLRKMKDGWKVYNVDERLLQDKKINLVWEQIAVKTPDMSNVDAMEGLNVTAPTWFELRKDTHKLGVKPSDPVVYKNWQGSIHMMDMGDNKFIEWAHNKGYDVWGLFRNEFDLDASNKVLNSEQARKKSIELLLEYTNKYKLDGINVDFENVNYSDRHVLSQFVRELAMVLREQGLITSVDVTKIEPTSWTWSMCYDRNALGEAADYIVLMAYDQNGSWSKKSGSVAQYSWVEKGLQGVLEQVPADKMLLGLPFYTRLWEEQNGRVLNTFPISMQKANDLINDNHGKVIWDQPSGQRLATYIKGNKTYKIWIEDTDSINLKTSLVHKYGLAGVASWRRGYETPDIWPALNKALNDYSSYQEWLIANQGKYIY
ncbi:S-layer homology domain-containing protein [Petroclostridium sp. X23]|uniref:S-layer homology domain-containing protein n=1 Tax=Petroclostridium sp. X23 TaxID=3045146 RepID=UPI0024ADFC44|nr:S-layer homology domain-containing protein [Petroclostridium sp. X23]WHH57235.1 S-layer homology domain-containing protein [Petroclostridium sp. X23]